MNKKKKIPEAHRGSSNIYVRLKVVALKVLGVIMGKVRQEALILFLIGLLM